MKVYEPGEMEDILGRFRTLWNIRGSKSVGTVIACSYGRASPKDYYPGLGPGI